VVVVVVVVEHSSNCPGRAASNDKCWKRRDILRRLHTYMSAHAHRCAVDMQCAGYDSRERSILYEQRGQYICYANVHEAAFLTFIVWKICYVHSGAGMAVWGSNPGAVSQETSSRPALRPAQTLLNWYWLSFPEVKRPGREVNPSQPSSDEVKNVWSYTFTPPICLNRVERECSTLSFTHL